MLIKSISIKNFQCYSGELEDNTFNFKSGLNLVVGNNGGGKSKLYDAFYWVLYDQIFNADTRKFVLTRDYREAIVSDKVKRTCSVGAKISTEVVLIATSKGGAEFKLTRIFEVQKKQDNDWHCASGTTLLINEMKGVSWASVPEAKHSSILSMVIPGHLKPYMWFQGEQVHDLMDFTDTSTLTRAIDLLSNIGDFDDLVKIVESGSKLALRKFQTEQRRAVNDEAKSQTLAERQDDNERKLRIKQNELLAQQENLEGTKNNIDKIMTKIGDAEEKSKLKANLVGFEKVVGLSTADLVRRKEGLSKKMYSDSWVLMNAQKSIEKYSTKYRKYDDSHRDLINVASNSKIRLPVNVPQPVYVQNMLAAEKCFVCGRDAREGSVEYEHIHSLIERDAIDVETNLFKNDYSLYFSRLYNNSLGYNKLIAGIKDKIKSEFSSIQNLLNTISENQKSIKQIHDEFSEIIKDDQSESIVNSFKTFRDNKDKYQSLVDSARRELEELEREKRVIEREISDLVQGGIAGETEFRKNIYGDLLDVAKNTREHVFHAIVEKLEAKANSLFVKMTAGNPAITGEIKIRRSSSNKYTPVIIGADGYELTSPNDANILLVKLALIMSIIGARDTSQMNYALISDAPTSKMAKEYSKGFYETVAEEYEQSIIMTYDFNDDAAPEMLSSLGVSTLHVITPDFPGGNANDRADLSISIDRRI